MEERLTTGDLQRIEEFAKTPMHERNPEMLVPDPGDGLVSEPSDGLVPDAGDDAD